MVVELLGQQRHPRHEAEGLVEIPELEQAGDGVAATGLRATLGNSRKKAARAAESSLFMLRIPSG